MTAALPPGAAPVSSRRQRVEGAALRAFRAYARWLVGISWWRFALLSVVLLIAAELLSHLPPFDWTISERVETIESRPPRLPAPPKGSRADGPDRPPVKYEVEISDSSVRIRPSDAASAASAAPAPQGAASARTPEPPAAPSIDIRLPPGVVGDDVRRAVEEARRDIEEAVAEARDAADEARRNLPDAASLPPPRVRVTRVQPGDYLLDSALLMILCSAAIKFSYKGRLQAETEAARATENAGSESLKRQVIEARMAAMQAQVEPHFLFNTLASIDHLIETDPQRASQMQKNLIALLRASMPSMREVGAGDLGASAGPRDLGRELAVVRPYLEILKVRMEERLRADIRVADGLLSAEFPPMMLQSLVENAIRHGLEPKAEGGTLTVAAEVVHGQLVVSVTDSGLGFGKSGTPGSGIGLSNIRERLQLLYGPRASLEVTENPGGGCAVRITVPYRIADRDTVSGPRDA